ncbi:hypothetical protein T10_12060 [Trichinella papuae]|uniref:Uncharacterized protein n=1 Tax=Trichinella papuae TaxID=268474 RepID=A0A0V1MB76_9BILA|nr:hypothetical protein T10_12060 [Trichinella papuae]
MHLWPQQQQQQQHNICLMLFIKTYAYFVCSENRVGKEKSFFNEIAYSRCSWGINSTLKLKWKFLNQIYPMAIKIGHLV